MHTFWPVAMVVPDVIIVPVAMGYAVPPIVIEPAAVWVAAVKALISPHRSANDSRSDLTSDGVVTLPDASNAAWRQMLAPLTTKFELVIEVPASMMNV